jgi:hypothetical protein
MFFQILVLNKIHYSCMIVHYIFTRFGTFINNYPRQCDNDARQFVKSTHIFIIFAFRVLAGGADNNYSRKCNHLAVATTAGDPATTKIPNKSTTK